jgi:ADP-L-glycero-D-manno-heptose 6-epimerase
MIVVTGGAGFIGYNLVKKLIETGHKDIVVVDNHISRIVSRGHQNITYVSVEDSYLWLGFNGNTIKMVYHLGARTDTMETDEKILNTLNINYSKFIWELCTDFKIPLIYASSAAVYGNGDLGFSEELMPEKLQPLNQYGMSKLVFDNWVETRETAPPYWLGLRFFNVYGNHEEHKGRMASVIWHLYNQIKESGEAKLFKSHRDDYMHGYQMRDFISVEDVVGILYLLKNIMHSMSPSIYNLGTGKARTYNDLAQAIFKSLGLPVNISYIDTPVEIRDSYQYFTEADMGNFLWKFGGYKFLELEEGIDLYIKQLQNENR